MEKFHGGMMITDPQRKISNFVPFTRHLHRRGGRQESQHLARVELTEIDCFSGLGFCFRPCLARLIREPCVEFELAFAEGSQPRGAAF